MATSAFNIASKFTKKQEVLVSNKEPSGGACHKPKLFFSSNDHCAILGQPDPDFSNKNSSKLAECHKKKMAKFLMKCVLKCLKIASIREQIKKKK